MSCWEGKGRRCNDGEVKERTRGRGGGEEVDVVEGEGKGWKEN